MNKSIEDMISRYVSAWNETTFENYTSEFKKCWAANAIYIDPYSMCNGLDELVNFAYKSLEIVPSRKFSIFEAPEFHHNSGRYAWKVEADGETNVGYDYFEFNDKFEITKLVSFFRLPADYPLERLN